MLSLTLFTNFISHCLNMVETEAISEIISIHLNTPDQ